MNDELSLTEVEDVTKFLRSIYKEEHPEFIISPRITQFIYRDIIDEYNGSSSLLELDNAELCDYLKGERFIDFIETRQPDVSKVPDNVMDDIMACFKNDIPGFTPLKACRHSNHPEDSYLYSVIAKKDNDGSYACWSTFNGSTKSMNCGHYNLSSENDAIDVIKQNFFDITDDMEQFGPEASMTSMPQEKIENLFGESGEVVPFRHRSR